MLVNYNKLLSEMPGITVIMIDSGRNDEWLKEAHASILSQVYPIKEVSPGKWKTQIELKCIKNTDRQFTIGQCWNHLIKNAEFDYIFILDDDDLLEPQGLLTLMTFLQRLKLDKANKDIIGVTPNVTFFEKKDGKTFYRYSDSYTSGLIEKKWLLKIPFDETLFNKVDMKWDEAIHKIGKRVAVQQWNHCYNYRQHNQMVSGRNVNPKYLNADARERIDIEVK